MSDRLPPHDIDAEKSVLSSSLLEPMAFDEARRLLTDEDFFLRQHQLIWAGMGKLRDGNRAVDLTTLAALLRDQKQLDQIGGTPYLAEVIDATPSVANIADHAKIVRAKSKLRTVIRITQERMAEAYEPGNDPNRVLSDLQAEIDSVSSEEREDTLWDIEDAVHEEVQSFYERRKSRKKIMGLPTGIRELDVLIGGLKRKCLYYIAARPGIGKTGWMTGICLHLAQLGYAVVVISIEMPRQQLVQRMIAQLAQLDIREIEAGTLSANDLDAYNAAADKLRRLPMVIDDSDQSAQSVRSTIRRGLYRIRRKFPDVQKLGLIAIDFLQLMKPDKDARTREEAVSRMSGTCKSVAKEFDCPVVALSQLNREVEDVSKNKDRRPQLKHLRESGSIEQDGFGIFMLFRQDYYREPGEPKDGRAEILVRKIRQGGATGSVECAFHGPSTHFADLYPELPGTNDNEWAV